MEHKNADDLSLLPSVATARQMEVLQPPEVVEGASWAEHQGQDWEVARIRQWLQDHSAPTPREHQSLRATGRQLLSEWERLEVRGG